MSSRRLLQIVNAVLAVLIIGLASASLLLGAGHPVYGNAGLPGIAALDSNLRFMGGMGLGLGLALLWIVPTIERRGRFYRLIWACAFLGGLGRLWSMAVVGMPPLPMVAVTLLEVPGVPALIYWQYRVERTWVDRSGRGIEQEPGKRRS